MHGFHRFRDPERKTRDTLPRPGPLPRHPEGERPGAEPRRQQAGHHRGHAERQGHRIRHRPVGTGPGRAEAGPPDHAQRQGRGRRRVRRQRRPVLQLPPAPTRKPPRPIPSTPCGCCPRTAARPASCSPGPAAVSGLLAAKDTGALFVNASVLAGSTDEDERRGAPQGAQGQQGRRHPAQRLSRALLGRRPGARPAAGSSPSNPGEEQEPGKPATVDAAAPLKLRNLTPDAGSGLRDAESVVSPDGKTIYSSFNKPLARADSRSVLVAIDVATGTRKVLLDTEGMSYFPGPVSPDNRTLVVLSESDTTPEAAPQVKLHLLDVSGGAPDGGEAAPDAARARLGPLAAPRRLAAGRIGRARHRRRGRRLAGLPDQRDRRRRRRPGHPR